MDIDQHNSNNKRKVGTRQEDDYETKSKLASIIRTVDGIAAVAINDKHIMSFTTPMVWERKEDISASNLKPREIAKHPKLRNVEMREKWDELDYPHFHDEVKVIVSFRRVEGSK
ncbi:hypothetical protein NPIL_568871 [Nephila pilipes]|uniref:Uncharacterized protein n=1 Tax=Nephila pilipes TaxID=299642 RepID=A0A8X6N4P5_NEPPI|nr:hypothetical protein NPIL_568871 [Nephila pilipes]